MRLNLIKARCSASLKKVFRKISDYTESEPETSQKLEFFKILMENHIFLWFAFFPKNKEIQMFMTHKDVVGFFEVWFRFTVSIHYLCPKIFEKLNFKNPSYLWVQRILKSLADWCLLRIKIMKIKPFRLNLNQNNHQWKGINIRCKVSD